MKLFTIPGFTPMIDGTVKVPEDPRIAALQAENDSLKAKLEKLSEAAIAARLETVAVRTDFGGAKLQLIELGSELDFYRRELRRYNPRLVDAHERNRGKP